MKIASAVARALSAHCLREQPRNCALQQARHDKSSDGNRPVGSWTEVVVVRLQPIRLLEVEIILHQLLGGRQGAFDPALLVGVGLAADMDRNRGDRLADLWQRLRDVDGRAPEVPPGAEGIFGPILDERQSWLR